MSLLDSLAKESRGERVVINEQDRKYIQTCQFPRHERYG